MSRSLGAWCLPLALALTAPPAYAAGPHETPLTAASLQDLADECGQDDTCRPQLCAEDAKFDFCDLRDDELAALALASDPAVTRWMANQARRIKSVAAQAKGRVTPKPATSEGSPLVDLLRMDGTATKAAETAADVASAATGRTVEQQIALAAAGLARLVADRMKQEGVGWALDSIGNELCTDHAGLSQKPNTLLSPIVGLAEGALIRDEVRYHYLRAFCGLARSPRLAGYGAGAATLQVVRDAVENDAKDIPGAVVGRGVETAFYGIQAANAFDEDAWRVETAKADARDAQARYTTARAKAAEAAAGWAAWSGTAVPALLLVEVEAGALVGVTTVTDATTRRDAAAAEALANLKAWDAHEVAHLSDDVAAKSLLSSVAALHAAATTLQQVAGDRAAALRKLLDTPGKFEESDQDTVEAAWRAATAAEETAARVLAWTGDGAKLVAAWLTASPPACTALDGLTERWIGLAAAQAAAKKACATGAAQADTDAYASAYLPLARGAAAHYRGSTPRAAALGSTATILAKAVADTNDVLLDKKNRLTAVDVKPATDARAALEAFDAAWGARADAEAALDEARALLAAAEPGVPAPDLREAVRVALRRIVDGGDPLFALGELGRALDASNRRPFGTDRRVLYSPEIQVFACAASFPAAHQGVLELLATDDPSTATIAAALTTAPACWEIFGEGHRMTLSRKGPDAWSGSPELAIDEPARTGRLERLTTARRLYEELSAPGGSIVASWRHLVATQAAVRARLDELASANTERLGDLKTEGLGKQEIDALTAALRGQVESGRQLLLLQLGVLDDALDIASTVSSSVRGGAGLVKGLCVTRPDEDCALGTELAPLDKVDAALAEVRKGVGLMKQVVSGKPAQALAGGLAELPKLCRELTEKADETACEKAAGQLATYGAGLAGVAEAETADEAAKALHGIANPPGGWKVKQTPGTTTVSITAHPGIMGGIEWRRGVHGVVLEQGLSDDQVPYFASPTLALPVGVETTTRIPWLSVYFPVLDPAAFLQYDVSEGGELPDPNLLTVLSPGVGLRANIRTTPFGVLVAGLYRPNLRSASGPAFSSTGADAFQLVVAGTVDVTLFSLHTRNEVK